MYPRFTPEGVCSNCEADSHAILTRSPRWCLSRGAPFDLHVLGLWLAFILSQDQTLDFIISFLWGSTLGLTASMRDAPENSV